MSQNQMTLSSHDNSLIDQFQRSLKGKPVTEFGSDINGTMYYKDDWIPGIVLFGEGQLFPGLPLKFNLHFNKLYYQKDNATLEFTTPIKAFWLGTDTNTAAFFRNGYTPVDRNTAETYYQVLVKGKIQLLKFREKPIQEITRVNMPKEKKFEDVETLYVFLPNYRIEKIRKSKSDILKALPEYADAINKILDANKLNLKNEEALITLFNELNKQ